MITKKETAGNLRQRMIEEMQLRRFSERTIESYVRAVGRLAGWCWKSPGEVGDEELGDYFLYLRNQKRLARATTTIALPPLRHPHGAARTHLAAYFRCAPPTPGTRPRSARRIMTTLAPNYSGIRHHRRRSAPLCPASAKRLSVARSQHRSHRLHAPLRSSNPLPLHRPALADGARRTP